MTTRITSSRLAPVTTQPKEPTAPTTPAASEKPAGWVAGTKAPASRPAATSVAPRTAEPLGTPTDPRQMDIVCPVLGALVGSGKLAMAPDGTVKFADLTHALKHEMGVTADLRAVALGVATLANPNTLHNLTSREFNALELRSGRFKHAADSAILTGGRFDEAKFQALVSHAENGRMTTDSFGKAIAANAARDAHLGKKAVDAGVSISKAEFALALTAFGTPGPDGKIGIAVEDLRMMFQHKQLPTHLVGKASVPELLDLTKAVSKQVDAQFAARAFSGPSTAGGLSQAGVRLATGTPDSAATAVTLSAGKAANCPHLNGGAKPMAAREVLASHLE
jgi:hypothetical protein